MLHRIVGVWLALLPVATAPLLAQADTIRRDTILTLAPVVVQAARSGRDVYALPLAVSRVSRQELFGGTGRGLDEALALVPGVVAQSRAGGTDVRITIRGFGARGAGDRSNSGTTRGIRILLDGFPETEPDGRTSLDGVDLASVQGIEVVRSNASAVWGNAAGGVISLSTLPAFGTQLLETDVAAGSFGLARAAVRTSALTAPGQLAFSLVHARSTGWRAHSEGSRSLLNVALRTAPAQRTHVAVYGVASDNFFRIPGPLTAAQLAADPRQANATYATRDERRHNRVARIGVAVGHDVSNRLGVDGLFYLQPKVLQRSERGTFRDFTRYHIGGQAGVRLVTPLGGSASGTLRAGVDAAYQDGAVLFYSLTPGGTRGDTLRNDQREGARNAGVYLQEELDIDRLSITLGARYDDIHYVAEDFLNPALAARKWFTGLSPKLGLAVRLGLAHSIYAAVGGGVEAPAGNETDPASTFGQDTVTALNPLLDPIRSTTFEVGTRRAISFGGPLRELSYDVAVFDTEVRNEIVPYRGGRFYFSAGRVRRAGVELGVGVRAAGGVTLQTAFGFAHHRYREYVVDSVHYGVPGAFADYAGNRVVGIPAFTYTVSMETAPPPLSPLWARVTIQGSSAYFADDANAVRVDGYTVINAALGAVEAVRLGQVRLRGFVAINNLLDRTYTASAFLNPDVVGGVPVAYEPGLPRNVVVGVTLGAR